MRIYTKTPQYVIWENEDFTYQIQMIGEDNGSTVYDYAAEAIIAAEEMKK